MKKILIASLLLLGTLGVGVVRADQESFKVPVSANRIADIELKSAGVEKCLLVNSTIPALATDRNGNTMTNGLIYWVISPSTIAVQSAYLEFRDTNTANVSSAYMLPPLPTNVTVTTTTVLGGQPYGTVTRFDPPIPFYNGLSLDIGSSNANTANSGLMWAVGIRTKK